MAGEAIAPSSAWRGVAATLSVKDSLGPFSSPMGPKNARLGRIETARCRLPSRTRSLLSRDASVRWASSQFSSELVTRVRLVGPEGLEPLNNGLWVSLRHVHHLSSRLLINGLHTWPSCSVHGFPAETYGLGHPTGYPKRRATASVGAGPILSGEHLDHAV